MIKLTSRCMLAGLACLTVAACQRDRNVDPSTVDAGATRNPPRSVVPPPPQGTMTLASGATVVATPAAMALKAELESNGPPGKRIRLQSIRFVKGGQVREDPDGSIATLATILREHPRARVRIEVARPVSSAGRPEGETENLASQVADAFVRNGASAQQITTSGAISEGQKEELTYLVVTAK